MSRRRRCLLCLAFLLTLSAFACWLYVNRDRVSQATFDKVELGMTFTEVDDLFRRKPDHFTNVDGTVHDPSTFLIHYSTGRAAVTHPTHRLHQWTSSELTAVVVFNRDGLVVCRYTGESQPDAWYQRFLRAVERSVGR